jgi:hypothetical protein
MTKKSSRTDELRKAFSESIGQIDPAFEKDFINDLANAVSEPLKRIPEPVFREIFLPYFTGDKLPDRSNDAISHWVGLVGSATSEAEVVNTRGDVIFRVPALYDTTVINSSASKSRGASFSAIFDQYEDNSKIHKDMARGYLANALAEKGGVGISDQKDAQNAWLPILKHYKLVDDKGIRPGTTEVPGDEGFDFGD